MATPREGLGVSATIAEYAASMTAEGVPRAAIRSASLSLMDHLGASLAATTLGEGCEAFVGLAADEAGTGHSTLLASGLRVPAAAAALANGALSHALDFEDSVDGLPVHPNAQVIPAVLALAEDRDASGERLLTAIAVGCDLTARVAAAGGDLMARRGWYPPPLAGAIGATVACANLVGLSPAQTLDALSLVQLQVSAPGEIKHAPESTLRGVRDAFAAHAAVRSVALAERGVRGFDEPLEGRAGFFTAYAGESWDDEELLRGLGRAFRGTEVSYKPWPSCRGTHAFLDACVELHGTVAVQDIEAVELLGAPVNTMLAEPRSSKIAPKTAIDAKFSLPFTTATALIDGTITLASFAREALARPDVLSLAERVTFVPDPSFDVPERMTAGRTTVRLTGGRTIVVDTPYPPGNPAAPLGLDTLRRKFVDCATHARTTLADPHAFADSLLAIASAPSVRQVMASQFPAPQPADAVVG
ncbi:MmgE/PrpD family protein [Sinomonas susongensis]|uniref:MmgE/PrpD family protein n=1 Tax=Sinomonas susongensis TaxID=1324851 RepID=UPI0011088F42|nr:MmgE/PrpD family protein [Sinomonas susongensis]